jgi:hypothetical protein
LVFITSRRPLAAEILIARAWWFLAISAFGFKFLIAAILNRKQKLAKNSRSDMITLLKDRKKGLKFQNLAVELNKTTQITEKL